VAEQPNQAATKYVIPRATGTHGDVFAAVGLADLLASVADAGTVRIMNTGMGFEVTTSEISSFNGLPAVPGYPFLKTNEKTSVPKGAIEVVDYKIEKAKADRRKKFLQGKTRKSASSEIDQLLEQDKPLPTWRLLQVLNTLQGDETTNRVYAQIMRMKPADFLRAVTCALRSLSAFEPSRLDWSATSVQLFTPNAAKGYSRLKPDSTDRNDKTKEQWTDPFIEWLRYRGYFIAACPFFQGKKAENVRLLCPVPRDIGIDPLRMVAAELRRIGISGGPPKVDSLAALKLAELLIRYSEEYHDADKPAVVRLFGKTPADVISGISVTHYQSLGNAKAVSAISTVALPGWLTLRLPQDASAFLDTLGGHQRVVRSLRDDHSDEIGLLIDYRRFLETRGEYSIRILVEFMSRYGALVLRAREQGRRISQFTANNFERLLMQNAPKLSSVLEDPGFQAVASAIRNATVNAQAHKAMSREYREIRYDLIPELRRKSSLPGNEPLIQTLSDFISKYNIENARRRELGKPAPRNVTTDELHALIRIVESGGAATVGPMLCAYASCRVPREPDLGPEAESETAGTEQE
jgi:hypothetical protein